MVPTGRYLDEMLPKLNGLSTADPYLRAVVRQWVLFASNTLVSPFFFSSPPTRWYHLFFLFASNTLVSPTERLRSGRDNIGQALTPACTLQLPRVSEFKAAAVGTEEHQAAVRSPIHSRLICGTEYCRVTHLH